MCEAGETCTNCSADCGVCGCAHDMCKAGGPLASDCDPCVTQVCAQFETCCVVAWGSACLGQVAKICNISCNGGPVCGNGSCETGEDCTTCPGDCGKCPPVCGNGHCEPGEDCTTCPGDCGACLPSCGNGTCDSGEDCSSCPGDCGACPPACGNNSCEPGEDCTTCPSDCGACPVCHDVCKDGPALDPSCDACADFVCNVFGDSFCCTDLWDKTCIFEAAFYCATCM